MVSKKGRALIGDEMGVGKTIQALACAAVYKSDWPILIICPSSLKFNWQEESIRWLGSEGIYPSQIQIIAKRSNLITEHTKILIISYDLLKMIPEKIAKNYSQGVVICDEAHYLKSKSSLRTKSILPILKQTKRVLMLTGTPAISRPIEIFNLISAVRPDIFEDYGKFGSRYCDPKRSAFGKGYEYKGATNKKELNIILKNVMIRRLKKDVCQQLPKKIRQTVTVQSDPAVLKQINALRKEIENTGNSLDSMIQRMISKESGTSFNPASSGNEKSKLMMQNIMTKMFKLSGEAKIKGILEYLEDLLSYDKKYVIFAHHLNILDKIQEFAEKKKVKFMRIDGSVDPMKRGLFVKDFQEKEDVRLAILGIKAASTGLTLTASSTVLFAELYWTPADIVQAEDRVHRVGQNNGVNIIFMMGEKTIDYQIFNKIVSKFDTMSEILDGENAQQLETKKGTKESTQMYIKLGVDKALSKQKNTKTISDFFGSKITENSSEGPIVFPNGNNTKKSSGCETKQVSKDPIICRVKIDKNGEIKSSKSISKKEIIVNFDENELDAILSQNNNELNTKVEVKISEAEIEAFLMDSDIGQDQVKNFVI